MEQIVTRIRRLCTPLRDISDALLLVLLSQSEYVPDSLNTGTIRNTLYFNFNFVNVLCNFLFKLKDYIFSF